MAEQPTPGIEAAQFEAPSPSVALDILLFPIDASMLSDDGESETTSRFYDSYARYGRAILERRNSGKETYNAFFPKDSEALHERASVVTDEELVGFYKRMNEQWTAANQFDQK